MQDQPKPPGDDRQGLISTAERVWQTMTWTRFTLMAATGIAAIALFWVWEHRDTAIPSLIQSNPAMLFLTGAVVMGTVGTVGGSMLTKYEAKSEELRSYLVTTLDEMRAEIDELKAREAECKDELGKVRGRLSRAEATLRDVGRPFGDTT